MSPPGPEAVDAALAALTGTVNEARPGNDLERNLVRLRLVMEAKARGVSWAAVGRTMGISRKGSARSGAIAAGMLLARSARDPQLPA